MKNKTLILLRHVPGSGSSFTGKLLSENGKYPVLATDNYFMVNEEYKFDKTKLHYHHQLCLQDTEKELIKNIEKIFVTNTFTREKELNPYIELSKKYNYNLISLIVENRHGNKNIHNVPEENINKMEIRLINSIKLK